MRWKGKQGQTLSQWDLTSWKYGPQNFHLLPQPHEPVLPSLLFFPLPSLNFCFHFVPEPLGLTQVLYDPEALVLDSAFLAFAW